jgi:hypothetical protein|eukprot:COSAG06_NODE_9543_length_1874_cov_4.378028_3_plen_116_part_00
MTRLRYVTCLLLHVFHVCVHGQCGMHDSLRFAMVIPVPQLVDCTVTQGSVTHTWSQYGFGTFSGWITTFKAAPAQLKISSGGVTLLTESVSLTTGTVVEFQRTFEYRPFWDMKIR